MHNNKSRLTRTQKIAICAIATTAVFALVSLFFQIKALEKRIEPVIEMKPQIINVINNITKVEKEIANITEVISQQYGKFMIERFTKEDIGKTVATYPHPLEPNKNSVVFFELRKKPVQNSTLIFNERGAIAPPTTYSITSNIINVTIDTTPDKILKEESQYFEVKYIPDPISSKKMLTIKGLEIKKSSIDGKFPVEYKSKEGVD